MSLVVQIAHDYTCPWCYIALHQAKKLKENYDVEFDWVGYEMWPEELEWPEPSAPPESSPRPRTPTRFELAMAAEGLDHPKIKVPRPSNMRIHNALEAAEYAKSTGEFEALNEKLYTAYWEQGRAIGEIDVILELAEGIVKDLDALKAAMVERKFRDKIVPFDDEAHEKGVWNVPTFFINGGRYAEQPRVALERVLKNVRK